MNKNLYNTCFLLTILFTGLGFSQSLQAQRDPSVKFTWQVVGNEVHFTDNSTGDEVSRTWYFGDGSTSTDKSPTHLYANPGPYQVKLEVEWTVEWGGSVGDSDSKRRRIVVPDVSELHHFNTAVRKNSMNNVIDLLEGAGLDPSETDLTLIAGPYSGTHILNTDGTIEYTPTNGYVGWDVMELEVANSDRSEIDTGFVFIEVYDGACGFYMDLVSDWHNCPDGCSDSNGSSWPQGQPSADPMGTQCYGYTFTVVNPTDEPLTMFTANVEIAHGMKYDGAHDVVAPDSMSGRVNIEAGEDSSRLTFTLKDGEEIGPGEEYHFSFTVFVFEDPDADVYHTILHGNASCGAGSRQFNTNVSNSSGNACDPNEIHVLPEGCGTNNFIDTSITRLTYTIEFENIGTDTARTVQITDILPLELDPASVHVIDAYPTEPKADIDILTHTIDFTFKRANVPPTMDDSLESRGYVKFTVDLFPNLPDGTEIKNHAEIYFDGQQPVGTDTTLNTVSYVPPLVSHLMADTIIHPGDFPCYPVGPLVTGGSGNYSYFWNSIGFRVASLTLCPFANGYIDVTVTDDNTGCQVYDRHYYSFGYAVGGIDEGVLDAYAIEVAPNPFRGRTSINIASEETSQINVTVHNSVGQQVANLYEGGVFAGQKLELDFNANGLPTGVYFYRITNDKGRIITGKLMLMK